MRRSCRRSSATLRLRPYRRGRPPPDRLGRARLLRCMPVRFGVPPEIVMVELGGSAHERVEPRRWPDLAGRISRTRAGARHRAARARLLRGHRFLGARLSRELSALVRARPLRFPAPARQRPSRADRRARTDASRRRSSCGAWGSSSCSPARIDDMLEVETRVKEIGAASLTLAQRISARGRVLFEAEVTVVLVAVSGKPLRDLERAQISVRRSTAE